MKECCVTSRWAGAHVSALLLCIGAPALSQPIPPQAATDAQAQQELQAAAGQEAQSLSPLEGGADGAGASAMQSDVAPKPLRQAGAPLPFAAPSRRQMRQSAPSLLALPPLNSDTLVAGEANADAVAEPNNADRPAADGTATNALAESAAIEEPGAIEELAQGAAARQPIIVQAQQLSSQDVAAIGLLTPADAGFTTQIWRNTRARAVLKAWDAAPVKAPSPVMHETMRALALAVAAAPPVSDARAWDLLEKRVDALTQLGDLPGALGLIARAPSDMAPSTLLQKKAEIALWAHDWLLACEAARIGLDRAPSPYWTDISLACHAVAGNRAAVDLLLDVLGPGEQPTRQFMAAIYGLLDDPDAAETREPQPLDTANALLNAIAARRGQRPVLDAGFVDAPAIVHASFAQAGGQSLAARWPAMAALAYRSRIEPSDMIQYALAADPATPADPSLGMAIGGLQQALYRNAARLKVRALLALSAQARRAGMSQFWAPGVGKALAALEPDESLWLDAGAMAGHLAFAGEGAAVGRLYGHIRANAQGDDLAAARSLISVWPYAVLLAPAGEVPFTARLAQLWWQTQSQASVQDRVRMATYFYTALEALGYPIAPELWASVGQVGTFITDGTPASVNVAGLKRMADNAEIGRGILSSFAAMGADGPVSPDPQAMRAALRTLVQLGHADIARRLAGEVLFFQGVSLADGADGG